MKKSVKILTLVLSLALLCGALVVAAFAEDTAEITGVKVDFSTDFTGTTAYGTAGGAVVPSREHGFVLDNKGSGVNKIVVSEYDGNSYFSWDYTENVTTVGGNYSYTAPKAGQAWGSPTNYDTPYGGYYYTDNSYFAFDFDIYFPKDVPSNNVRAYYYSYVVTEHKEGDATTYKMTGEASDSTRGPAVVFNNSDDGVVAYNPVSGEKYSIVGGAWNHFTLIVEPVINGETLSLRTYTVLNGTIMDISDYIPACSTTPAGASDLLHWTPKTVRFEYGGGDQNGNIVNVDNVAVRRFTKDYNGNLATLLEGGEGTSLEAWESNLYDADNMPFSTPVAYVGEVAYDTLQKAVDAAEEGETITLCANTTNVVTVDKVLTIECGEYTMPNPLTADGYVWEKVGTAYEITETQASVWIEWSACTCPICQVEPDETHPGGVEADGYLNNTLSSYHEKAGKSSTWSLNDGGKTYTLVGWMDEDTEEIYELDAPITEEMVEAGLLYLAPVIRVDIAPFKYDTDSGVAYTTSLKTAITNVKAGGTITLEADGKYAGSAITIGKEITLNLNGHALIAVHNAPEFTSKQGLFSVNANFTILGEEEGSVLISYYASRDNVNDDGSIGTAVQPNNPSLTVGRAVTINIEGTNLYFNASQMFRINTSGVTINIDGGTYAKDRVSDGYGPIYLGSGITNTTVNIKNATITASGFFSSYNTVTGNTLNIDNCKLLATNLFNTANANVAATITNSYVSSNCTGAGATVVIGEGCYIREPSWINDTVSFASGVALVDANETVTFTVLESNPLVDKIGDNFVVVEGSNDVYTKDKEITFTKQAIKGITVTFKDGETTLASVTGKAGDKVVGPAAGAAEPVADGWVMATKAYAYTIPTDATEDITVDIATVTEFDYTYAAGTPKLYANFGISENLSTQLYVPATLPEGVVITDITLNGSNSGRTLSGNFTIGGVAYVSTQGWPCAWGADEGTYWVLTYTYEGITVTYKVTVDIVNYAKKVVDIYATDAEKIQQVTALLQYVEAANKIKGSTISNGLSETLAVLKETVTIPTIATEYTADLTQLKQYISGAKIALNPSRGGSFVFTLSAAAKEAGYGVKIVGVNNNVVGTNYKNGAVVVADTVYTDNIKISYWAASDITINVYDAEDQVVATGTYSLAAYYNEMKDSMTADEISLAQAMYALAVIGDTNK